MEEGYPAAATIQLLNGRALYRDIWFDKPPLFPYLYLLWGAWTGWPLRVAGALFVFLCCVLMYRFAAQLWTEREGLTAGALLAFYLTFGIPSAVMALAPDLLMIAPHIVAVWLAWRGRAFWAGLAAGIGLLVNTKAVFVLAVCLLWRPARTLLGFAIPAAAAFAWFGRPYWEQVWTWGSVYAAHGFDWSTGFTRTANWAGFQAGIVVAAAWFLWKERSWRMAVWVVISVVAVAAGLRFFPRYYFHLLVPVTLMASRGLMLMGRARVLVLALLLIPLVRFGPRYVALASDLIQHRPHHWSDLELADDSRAAADLITDRHGSLLVWGYRPDVFAYTRMRAGSRFLDSQPLTGVLADRHLISSEVLYPELASRNRAELVKTAPDFIVDGLGPMNPSLAIANYPDLRAWLANYHEIGRTRLSIVYGLSAPEAVNPLF